jgi:hypothetical protein
VPRWTVPDRDEARRIIFHLKHPEAHITPPWYSYNGRWILRYHGVDLESNSLGGLMDEAEDFESLDMAARGTTWERHFIAGEPNFAPLVCALIWHRLNHIDSRTKLPRRCMLQAPVMFRPGNELNQRIPGVQLPSPDSAPRPSQSTS